jgi:hypothetical protein
MRAGPRNQFTIGHAMAIVAAFGLLLAVFLTPGFAPILGVVVLPSVIVGIGGYLAFCRLVELFYGQRCPGCGVRSLERRAVISFGERFFLCTNCGVRCRRSLLGFYGMFFWRDASGPEYEAFYQRTQEEDPWNAPPGLEDEDEQGLFSKTHLNLVRNKRLRTPENPNGPGVG